MAHVPACQRVKVAECPVRDKLPIRFFERLEQDQLLPTCCRHPENHDIEAFFTSETQAETGIADLYIFYCTCGKRHVRLMGGNGDKRQMWEIK